MFSNGRSETVFVQMLHQPFQFNVTLIQHYQTQAQIKRCVQQQRSWQEIFRALEHYQTSIIGGYRGLLDHTDARLRQHTGLLSNFRYILQNISWSLDVKMASIVAITKSTITACKSQLDYFQKIIESYNPERQLKLGYSIAKIEGHILKSAKSVKNGDNLDILLVDGIINSKATNIKLYGKQKEK